MVTDPFSLIFCVENGGKFLDFYDANQLRIPPSLFSLLFLAQNRHNHHPIIIIIINGQKLC